MLNDDKFPCPCCGYRVFVSPPGGHEKCPICGWEDDLAQLRFVRLPGSANHVSLEEAQQNYRQLGIAERRYAGRCRGPLAHESREPEWRPIDAARDNIEEPNRGTDYAETYPLEDTTVLYYWRATYWRRLTS